MKAKRKLETVQKNIVERKLLCETNLSLLKKKFTKVSEKAAAESCLKNFSISFFCKKTWKDQHMKKKRRLQLQRHRINQIKLLRKFRVGSHSVFVKVK